MVEYLCLGVFIDGSSFEELCCEMYVHGVVREIQLVLSHAKWLGFSP